MTLARPATQRRNKRPAAGLERSLRELRHSRARIFASADLERRRIERDLHDGAQHGLVALRVRIGLARQRLADDPTQADQVLHELSEAVDAVLQDVRRLAKGVYPSVLADRGLVEALRAAARNSPLPVIVRAENVDRYREDVEAAVYFSCMEALQNAVKHAQDASVRISLEGNGTLCFEVGDDGVGFAVTDTPAGSGLANMRDRVEAVGGSLTLRSAPGEGTTVAGVIPLNGAVGRREPLID